MKTAEFTVLEEDCCGCHACEVACKQEHRLDTGPRLIRVVERSPSFIPIYCRHCTDAVCGEACSAGAIYRNEQGIVLIEQEKCVGCKACLEACPFGAMQFDPWKEKAIKCDLCFERLMNSGVPACASVCPTRCIIYHLIPK